MCCENMVSLWWITDQHTELLLLHFSSVCVCVCVSCMTDFCLSSFRAQCRFFSCMSESEMIMFCPHWQIFWACWRLYLFTERLRQSVEMLLYCHFAVLNPCFIFSSSSELKSPIVSMDLDGGGNAVDYAFTHINTWPLWLSKSGHHPCDRNNSVLNPHISTMRSI